MLRPLVCDEINSSVVVTSSPICRLHQRKNGSVVIMRAMPSMDSILFSSLAGATLNPHLGTNRHEGARRLLLLVVSRVNSLRQASSKYKSVQLSALHVGQSKQDSLILSSRLLKG
jgi:hypothetical protein